MLLLKGTRVKVTEVPVGCNLADQLIGHAPYLSLPSCSPYKYEHVNHFFWPWWFWSRTLSPPPYKERKGFHSLAKPLATRIGESCCLYHI